MLQQTYSRDDDRQHIRYLLSAFKDPRYIKVGGKPLFLVYRIEHLPEPAETVRHWRDEATKAGLPGIYLANVESFPAEHGATKRLSLDAAVEFAPDWKCLAPPVRRTVRPIFYLKRSRDVVWWNNYITDYRSLAENMLRKPKADYLRYRCVTPMWDNSAHKRWRRHSDQFHAGML